MSRQMLKLEHIRKSYQDGAERNLILDDISFYVEAGEFAAIVGPSGSGKSTLLSISGMMLSPDSRCIYLDGNNLSGLKQSEWTKIRMEHRWLHTMSGCWIWPIRSTTWMEAD